MSSNPDDGGPAFPSPGYSDDGERRGMSLRDWFAGLARVAYEIADAMLAERRK